MATMVTTLYFYIFYIFLIIYSSVTVYFGAIKQSRNIFANQNQFQNYFNLLCEEEKIKFTPELKKSILPTFQRQNA